MLLRTPTDGARTLRKSTRFNYTFHAIRDTKRLRLTHKSETAYVMGDFVVFV
jgi:hypothetical protein